MAIMLAEDLIHDPRSRTELRRGYNVPDLMEPTSSDAAAPVGGVAADIPWLSDEVGYEDLHGVLSRRVPLKVEVGTLREAARRARSVCRIEDATGNALGSGFRVSETSVLTNAHVLGMTDPEIRQAARTAAVRFNFTSDTERLGIPTERYLVDRREPLLAHSGVRELDFALLRIDRSVRDSPNVGVTELSRPAAVLAGGSLRLIGHPDQEFMSLSMLDNAILKVDRDRGFLHYACIGFPGQSGAPCFNHEWSPVALHRKAQARRGPVVQEGVLVEALLGSIARFL